MRDNKKREDKQGRRVQVEHEEQEAVQEERPLSTAELQGPLNPSTIQRLQQTVGNTVVQRYLAQRSGNEPTEIDDELANQIQSEQGHGQQLDPTIAHRAGQTLEHDFSQVNVHTDNQADQLSQQLGARAFTTGNDIFFRDGEYSPGTDNGQRLLAHELTHVVQQSGSAPVQGKMTVNDPADEFEQEADEMAEMVMNKPAEEQLQREALEEDEDELML